MEEEVGNKFKSRPTIEKIFIFFSAQSLTVPLSRPRSPAGARAPRSSTAVVPGGRTGEDARAAVDAPLWLGDAAGLVRCGHLVALAGSDQAQGNG